ILHKEGIYPYLFVIAKRMLISDFRKKIVRSKYQNHLSLTWNEQTLETQELLDEKDLCLTLERLMETLPIKEQEVFRLSKLQGMSYQEIAEQAGTSKNTVKNQLISASKKIKWKLKKAYYIPIIIFFLNL
ncbi:MAG: RNA polymerase sigma factor, partial [Sphingobacterium sp.]